MSIVFSDDYYSSLCELTSNKKPLIDMLSMLAGDNIAIAPSIVFTIETHLTRVVGDKLATLYLIDSICKSKAGGGYIHLFAQNLPKLFTMVFSQADIKTRAKMYKLRETWDSVFPPEILLLLDSLVYAKDPGWPVKTPPQRTNIHVNPAFITGGMGRHPAVKDIVKERILQEKKDLLELEKKKVELELLQTQKVLEKEQKKLESYTITMKVKPPCIVPDPTPVQTSFEKVKPSPVRNLDSEKNKILQGLSIRDPRRKTRHIDATTSSPLSETLPPNPTNVVKPSESVSSPSSLSDFSEDIRDHPPKKKPKNTKERKTKREKDSAKEKKTEKTYKPRSADGSKSNNGVSYKPSNTNADEYENMEITENEAILSTDSQDTLSGMKLDSKMEKSESRFNKANEIKTTSSVSGGSPTSDKNKPPNNSTVTEINVGKSLKATLTELFETGKPTIPVRTRDPRLKSDVSRSKGAIKPDLENKTLSSKVVADSQPEPVATTKATSIESSSVSNPENDLSNDLAITGSSDQNLDAVMINSPSVETSINYDVSSDVRSVDSHTLFEELKNSDEDSGSDISLKTTSKRKFTSEDDKENHKKILLHQMEGECLSEAPKIDDASPSISSTSHSEPCEPEKSLSSPSTPPLVAPPPPIISKSVSTLKNTDDYLVKSNESESTSGPVIIPSLVTSDETGRDVDLRLLLPRPIEKPKEELKIDPFPEDDPLKLFGGEDVDYRQKPPQVLDINPPSPPPAPVISNLQKSPGNDSWAQIKDRKSEEKIPSQKMTKTEEKFQSPKTKLEKPKRSYLSQSKTNVSAREVSRQSSQEHCNILIKEAEEQLKNGNISFVEYNKMLQDVVTINEERILKEAQARYSLPSETPEDESKPFSPLSETSDTEGSIQPPLASLSAETHTTKSNDSENTAESSMKKKKNKPSEKRNFEPNTTESVDPGHLSRGDSERERKDPPRNIKVWDDEIIPPSTPFLLGVPKGILGQEFPIFPSPNLPFQHNFRPRMIRPAAPQLFIPPVDMKLLNEAENIRTENITIEGSNKPIRFYGVTAVVLQSWDDPREVCFVPEKRKLIIDNRHEFVLSIGDAPSEIMIDGISSIVCMGTPGREIYIDNKGYTMSFGGMPVEILVCGRVRSVCLPGPPPIVNFSPMKRIDLVAGTVNLYINAKTCICFYLDATPQKFFIEREPCVLQFADSLLTVLINGIPVPLEFGGSPTPVTVRRNTYFLRLTCLPTGIIPGEIRIINMLSFAHPPPSMPPPILLPPVGSGHPIFQPSQKIVQQPVDVLANIINAPAMKSSSENRSYTVEKPMFSNASEENNSSATSNDSTQSLDINNLYQKLIQTGILNNLPKDPPVPKETKKSINVVEIEVDFSKPESLKCPRPSLVDKLYSGIQCSSCGIRFPPEGTKMYSRHLDWHFRQNKREKHSTRKPQSRNWYYSYPNWLQYQELDDIDDYESEPVEEEADEDSEEEIPSVPVGRRKNVACQVCGETFEEFFDHETEEWQARNAILMEELFYHPLCYEEFKTKKEAGPSEVDEKMEDDDLGPPLDDSPTVEVIDLDDTEVPSPLSSHDGETLPLLGTDKVESPDVIAVDDNSDEKSSAIDDVKGEESKDPPSDDDDILDIIPIVRKIESYDLVDDDEDDKVESTEETINLDDTKLDNTSEIKEEEFDFTKVTIKKEKDRVVADNVDSSLPTYTATIDGNIVHESAGLPIVPTGRIKINIHRSKQADELEPSTDSNDGLALSQPLPPGEDIVLPKSVKPKLDGIEMSSQPPVNQGYELSGLCSIM